ncbi:uncharacterized protein PAC_14601 [Phialocephala subalpina]|uniref:Uncharacterized protein n=1 Tax=Phialocephala subalpina TaxID=576137 RepID=A0A1L7XI43_9HELO|nr:uncharacterized protein PAC_14601 [Phialocephala subalpina]
MSVYSDTSSVQEMEIPEENIAAMMDLAPVANGWDRNLDGNFDRAEGAPVIRAFGNNPPSQPQSPNQKNKKNETLLARDNHSVNYSKSLLQEGDTLVIINYPNKQKVYDATGFEIRTRHRVHSEKLLATDSSVFKKLLLEQWEQHRAKRRNGLVGSQLPTGIKYVLDLTPPEEGDDALALTAELSCPTGLLLWHHAAGRVGIATTLVGGKDETHTPSWDRKSEINIEEDEPSVTAQKVTSVVNGITVVTPPPNSKVDKTNPPEPESLDYDPIRHRTGIERLLQVIEGKDPRLDSAPKVWTLAVLAKHFDCTSTVMDFVFTWVWADPNCRIIETCPEACLRMGMMLKSPRLVRTAFSVLVSEQALRISTYHHFPGYRDDEKKVRGYGAGMTRFYRHREFVDEDTLNTIQHAGETFAARIDAVASELLDPTMDWLRDLQEYGKLKRMTAHYAAIDGGLSSKRQQAILALDNELVHYVRGRLLWCFIAELEGHQLKRFNEHRVLEACQTLGGPSRVAYNGLRDKERLLTCFFWEIMRNLDWSLHCTTNLIRDYLPANHPFYDINHNIADTNGIRRVTMYHLVQLTKIVNQQAFDAIKTDKFNNGAYPPEPRDPVIKPTVSSVSQQLDDWSLHPPSDPSFKKEADFWNSKSDDHNADSDSYSPTLPDLLVAALHPTTYTDSPSSTKQPTSNKANFSFSVPTMKDYIPFANLSRHLQPPTLPPDELIHPTSPFFSLTTFFRNIDSHIGAIASKMLDRSENDWSVTCDTLLCLSDDEYKFLPLYAGGLDDGSGGVFEDAIPPAAKGPIGPGPSFHTGSTLGGDSTMGSRAASVADSWDGCSESFGTEMGDREMGGTGVEIDRASLSTVDLNSSLGVEDGYSEDHIDRRLVVAEEDFPTSLATSLPVRTKEDKGKGKEEDKGKGKEKEADFVMDDFMNSSEEDDADYDLLGDEDDEGEDEGNDTETE